MERCIYISRVTTSGEYEGHAYSFNKVVFTDEKGIPFIEKVKPDMLGRLNEGTTLDLYTTSLESLLI